MTRLREACQLRNLITEDEPLACTTLANLISPARSVSINDLENRGRTTGLREACQLRDSMAKNNALARMRLDPYVSR